MEIQIVLSHYQTRPLLDARAAGERCAETSLDLGRTQTEVYVASDGVRFPDGETMAWDVVEGINAAQNSCFEVVAGQARKVQLFSALTNQLYSLMPTARAPTMLISGIPMHRIKGTDPHRDTLEKVKAVKPVAGRVLDTATGLGYTAIEVARTADSVVTVELDPAALQVARVNPWSQALFENPVITQRIGDSYDVVEEFDDETFTRIVHDPPVFSLAGHLYSGAFYAELYRVLERGGRLFHYVGDPQSKSGRNTTRGVMRRLQDAGFSRVRRRPRAFGVLAIK
jgi:predicted methyltransferase